MWNIVGEAPSTFIMEFVPLIQSFGRKASANMCSSLGKVPGSEQETQTLPLLTLQSTEGKKHAQIIIPLTLPSHTAFLLKSNIT